MEDDKIKNLIKNVKSGSLRQAKDDLTDIIQTKILDKQKAAEEEASRGLNAPKTHEVNNGQD